MIDHINSTRARHIITLEDPIEYLHRDKRSIINQREVGQDTESFARAMRRVLRQDPDVILIGEMRDEETVRTALSAAETGHLVLSTLHTLDATETVNRIIDFFPPHLQQQARVMLAATLRGVVGQRLVPQRRRRRPRRGLRGARRHRPRPGPDPQPGGDRQDHRGDRRGRVLRDADLRPGAARARRWPGNVDEEVAIEAASSPHDFKLMLDAKGQRASGIEQVMADADGEPPTEPAEAGRATPAPSSQPRTPTTSFPEALAILGCASRGCAFRSRPRPQMAMNDSPCPVCCCAEIISGKWTLLVIRDLADSQPPLLRARALARGDQPADALAAPAGARGVRRSSSATPTPRCRRGSSTR